MVSMESVSVVGAKPLLTDVAGEGVNYWYGKHNKHDNG